MDAVQRSGEDEECVGLQFREGVCGVPKRNERSELSGAGREERVERRAERKVGRAADGEDSKEGGVRRGEYIGQRGRSEGAGNRRCRGR